MCIGIPMQVQAIEGGHAWVQGRGERRRIETALVAPVAVGDWLLVFLGSAREHLGARRAAEVNAALDLLEAAMSGDGGAAAAFDLPSRMDSAELAALTGNDAAPAAAASAPQPH